MLIRWLLVVVGFGLLLPAADAVAKPDHIVLGYSAGWYDDVCPAQDYAFDGLTHIARAFLRQKPDGSIDVPPGYFAPALETLAHQHGVKLLMSIGGSAEKADDWVVLASHPESLQRFVDTLGRLMTEHHYDGVDVDWEPAPLTDAEGVAYGTLLKALRAKFPQGVITTALPASEYWVSHMNWPDVLASVDFINVMTYDYAGGWGGIAAHGSNLFPPGNYPPQPEYSAAQGMANLLQNRHVPPEKLLLGVIFAGYRFHVDKIGDHFPVNGRGYTDSTTYPRAMDLLGTGHYLSHWDAKANMPYLQRDGGGDVVAYESPESIRLKCEYARKLGVAGVMIWNIGMDLSGRQAPLMDAVAQSFGIAPAVLGPATLNRQAADVENALNGVPHRDLGDPPAATRSADGSSVEQLETALAQLRMQWGVKDEDRWQKRKLQPASGPAMP